MVIRNVTPFGLEWELGNEGSGIPGRNLE